MSNLPTPLVPNLAVVVLAFLAGLSSVPAQAANGPDAAGLKDGSLSVQYRRAQQMDVKLSGAAAMLALRDELKLSDEQVQRLQELLAQQSQPATAAANQPPQNMAAKMAGMKKEMEARKKDMEARMKEMKAKMGSAESKSQAKKSKTPGMEAKMKEMMGGGEMKMSDSTMLVCKLVMGLKVAADDPAVALAAAKPPGLSNDQTHKLEKIRDRARNETRKLLSKDQARKLDQAVPAPTAWMDLYVKMLQDMQKMMAGMGK